MDKIVFFDGYCSLCNTLVDWLIRKDKHAVLKFASLQGETAKKLLKQQPHEVLDPDTIIYFRDGALYECSTAILLSLKDVGGVWTLSSIFLVVPKFLRDLVYRFVAKNRFRFFGRRETCRAPIKEEKGRLLP